MDLAFQLLPECRPVALDDMREIEVFFQIIGYGAVDGSGVLVEDALRITVAPGWGKNGLPDIELVAAAAACAQRQFPLVQVLDLRAYMTKVIAFSRPRGLPEFAVYIKGVLIVVDIDRGIVVEVHRVGTGGVAAVVFVGIKYL